MRTLSLDVLAQDELPELLKGIGGASPGPLFLVDQLGRSHPLNALATGLGGADACTEAFVSPVSLGSDRVGQVVGYVPPTAREGDAPLVSALVAIAAGVVSRSLGESARPQAAEPAPVADGASERAIEEACSRMANMVDEAGIADVLVNAARTAVPSSSVVLLVHGAGDVLEPLAWSGVDARQLGPVALHEGFLGWAATRPEPTVLVAPNRMPESFPRDGGGACVFEPWFQPPLVVMPLSSGSHLVGALCLNGVVRCKGADSARKAKRRIERLCERAAASLAGARLVRQVRREERVARELEIARQIQSSLLERPPARLSGLDVAGGCRPAAQVGGDFLGFRQIEPGKLTCTLFDVAGHGIGAAFCMTLVRSALHGELVRGGSLGSVVKGASRLLWDDLGGSGLFATAFVVQFDRDRGSMSYCSAGHPRPIRWSARRGELLDHPEGGIPLGICADAEFPDASTAFEAGDVVVAYTDGITEARSPVGEPFGRERLEAVVQRHRTRSAKAILRATWEAIDIFTDGRPLHDDATLLVVRALPGFGPRRAPRRSRRRGAVRA